MPSKGKNKIALPCRMYGKIYWKEIRQHRQEYLIIFFFLLVSIAVEFFDDPQIFRNTLGKLSWNYSKTSASFEIITMLTSFLLMYVAPALLLYSLYDEKRAYTVAQNLFLPVPRYMLLVSKCMGILSVLLLFDVIHAWVRYYASHIPFDRIPEDILGMFIGQFSILGIVVAATGISYLLSRNRVLFGFAGAFLFVVLLRISYRRFHLGHTFTKWLYDTFHLNFFFFLDYLLSYFMIPALFAGTLFLIGLFLYHKRAEV